MKWSTVAFTVLTAPIVGVVSSPAIVRAQQQVLVPAGAVWRYLDDGSDPGAAWREPDFVDNAWKAGPAKLGYGGDGEVTVVDFGADPR